MENQPSKNPLLIQKGDASRTPLFLLHDAGGTVSNYYKLGNIGRPIYTIYNPWTKSQDRWNGGSMKLVTEYIKLIQSIVSSGDILVGGWSLGGQLSIDVGRVLAQNPRSRLRVIGVVMIDTVYPYWGPPDVRHAELPADIVLKHCPPDMKAAITRCMKWSKEDSDAWVSRNWKTNGLDGIEGTAPSPAVLLLANKYVPVANPQTKCMVDYLRHAKAGWDLFPHKFIAAVWEIPAHHFGLFEKDTIRVTTEKIRLSCDLLADD